MLHALCRNYYSGQGQIVDAGPFLGGSTVAMLDGLIKNPSFDPKRCRVHSYDLFKVGDAENNTWGSLGQELGSGQGFLDKFKENLGDKREYVVIHAGDILSESWSEGPIEILFIDIAKTPEILAHVEKTFFPYLIPGKSIIIHQDYQYPGCPWHYLSMTRYREYMSLVEYLPCNSAVFFLEKEIPQDVLTSFDYRALGDDERLALHRTAIEDLPIAGRLMLELDEVLWLQEAGKLEEAIDRLLAIQKASASDLGAYAMVVGTARRLLPELYVPEQAIDPVAVFASDKRMELASQMTPIERMTLFLFARALEPDRVLEVGRARGGSTYILAEALRQAIKPSKFVSLDPNNWPEHSISPVLRSKLSAQVCFIDGYCPYELPAAEEAAGGRFDLVFLDGDHSYEAVKRDLLGLLPYVVDGGYILMHDAHFHPLQRAIQEVVDMKLAIDCGNLIQERCDTLSHIIVDGQPSYYGGMHLLRKPVQLYEEPPELEKLRKKVRQLSKELEREKGRRFWFKLKRSFAKRFGRLDSGQS